MYSLFFCFYWRGFDEKRKKEEIKKRGERNVVFFLEILRHGGAFVYLAAALLSLGGFMSLFKPIGGEIRLKRKWLGIGEVRCFLAG